MIVFDNSEEKHNQKYLERDNYESIIEDLYCQLIDIYLKTENYNEISQIIKKIPDSDTIQSKLIVISKVMNQYIEEGAYEKIEKIAKYFPSEEVIQSLLIKAYINQNRYSEAEEIAKRFPDYEIIQSQLMKIYINQNRYSEAEEIARHYPNNEIIQSQLTKMYINQQRCSEAEKIEKTVPNNEIIQNQLKKEETTMLNVSHYKTNVTEKGDKLNKKQESSEENTIYKSLNKKYKEKVLELKIKFCLDMQIPEKRDDAIRNYDKLQTVLMSDPTVEKRVETFVLMLMLTKDINDDLAKDYPKAYTKVKERIETKRKEMETK